ncbi:MAG: glycosyltransferase family 4 protein [Bacillus sp. (in: firmicutes)]
MKVLHVISGGETGGSRKHVVTLLEQYPRETVCLAVFQDGQLAEEARQEGIRVEVFSQKSRYDLSVLSRLKNFINEEGFDIVHSHGPRANLFMSFLKSKINAIWVTTIHSDPKLDFMKGGLKGKVFTKLNLYALGKIDAFFAVSERFKENLVQFGIPAEKIYTIYNGIHFTEPLKRDGSLQNDLNLSDDDFIMTMVARLHPIKGHDIVLQAMKQLQNERLQLVLVGDGPIRKEIEDKVKELQLQQQVHFLGFRRDVDKIYSNSHIALLASHSESFPLALLEAANQKLPLISTDVGGVRQLITSEKYGWVVPVNDSQAYAEAIEAAFNDYEHGKLEQKGEDLYAFSSSHFSLKALADNTEAVYRSLLKK